MTEYTLTGVVLDVPEKLQTPTLKRMLEKGWYEIEEIRAIRAHLQSSDVVLELGGGVGYLSSFCAQTVGPENVTTVEANPEMISIIEKNLSLNKFKGVTVLQGIAVETSKCEKEDFYLSDAFWSGTKVQPLEGVQKAISLKVISLAELFDRREPTFLIMDIEGSEVDFFYAKLPEKIRLIIIELHPSRCSPLAIKGIFFRLFEQGFVYETTGSHGAIVVFKRH